MLPSSRRRCHFYALFGYAAIAVVFTWPLVPHFGTHLTGSPAGDTGVYVWNQWVFQHELLENRSSPYFTDKIFSLSGRANLSLHNYTAFQDLVALPFVNWLGVVATFNLVYLLMTVLTGYATFLLARHVTGRAAEAWLAGLLFAWSPILVTRGGAHFSLVAAAPLAIFLLLLLRAAERQRIRDAVALGATCCVGREHRRLLRRVLRRHRRRVHARPRPDDPAARRATRRSRGRPVDARRPALLRGGAGALDGDQRRLAVHAFCGRVASMRSLYTPMLVLTLLACHPRRVVVPGEPAAVRRRRAAARDAARRGGRRRRGRAALAGAVRGRRQNRRRTLGLRSGSSGAAALAASTWPRSCCRTRTTRSRPTPSARG